MCVFVFYFLLFRHYSPLLRHCCVVCQTRATGKATDMSRLVAWYAWEVGTLRALVEVYLILANHSVWALACQRGAIGKAEVDKADTAHCVEQPRRDTLQRGASGKASCKYDACGGCANRREQLLWNCFER